jgi:enoyl-CoA hydratase/carnithine racemase
VLTLSDPATRNTLSEQLVSAGIEALNVAESDDEVRAVVLRGEGANFCAGGNVQGLAARREAGVEAQVQVMELLHQFIEAIRVFPKPVIAAVEGAAAGAGFSLALDLRPHRRGRGRPLHPVARQPRVDAGRRCDLAPRAVAAAPARAAVGLAGRAGERTPAACTRAGQPGHRQRRARWPRRWRLAARLAAMAPNALAGAKELVQQALTATLTQQLESERNQFVEALFHSNAGEGLHAFFDKRAPHFR